MEGALDIIEYMYRDMFTEMDAEALSAYCWRAFASEVASSRFYASVSRASGWRRLSLLENVLIEAEVEGVKVKYIRQRINEIRKEKYK
jgi:hypothetical protein